MTSITPRMPTISSVSESAFTAQSVKTSRISAVSEPTRVSSSAE